MDHLPILREDENVQAVYPERVAIRKSTVRGILELAEMYDMKTVSRVPITNL